MTSLTSEFLRVVTERGFMHQCTDLEGLDKRLASRVSAAYIGFDAEWIHHLYVLPEFQGEGLGPQLLAKAMADNRPKRLWTFQQNTRARRFYEDRGFVAVEFTDGRGNEEMTPDVCYEWRPDRSCPGV